MSQDIVKHVTGKCLKLGDNINSDIIIPGRYLTSIDPVELARHAFEPMGEEFQQRLWKTEVILAGQNFGCGSAREQAASCLTGAGVKAVIAASFARVFFRNAINTGLIAIESRSAAREIADGDEVSIDMESGLIRSGGKEYPFPPYPETLSRIFEAGGLLNYVAAKLGKEGTL